MQKEVGRMAGLRNARVRARWYGSCVFAPGTLELRVDFTCTDQTWACRPSTLNQGPTAARLDSATTLNLALPSVTEASAALLSALGQIPGMPTIEGGTVTFIVCIVPRT